MTKAFDLLFNHSYQVISRIYLLLRSKLELTGHFSIPNTPKWPGFDQFEGRILHSHDFRDAKEFSGKDVLVIGTSYSAEDIALQCYKYVCEL